MDKAFSLPNYVTNLDHLGLQQLLKLWTTMGAGKSKSQSGSPESSVPDYYKLLNVEESATGDEIKVPSETTFSDDIPSQRQIASVLSESLL